MAWVRFRKRPTAIMVDPEDAWVRVPAGATPAVVMLANDLERQLFRVGATPRLQSSLGLTRPRLPSRSGLSVLEPQRC